LGFILSLLISKKKENAIGYLVFYSVLLHFLLLVPLSIYWLYNGHQIMDERDLTLMHTEHYEFFIDLYFDKITLVYLLVGSFITLLVARYSQYYMHRESGYKRFFNTLLFFFTGYNLAVLSGNLETLFIGWEFLGISSFLLIAFYRDRYLPVKNAVKVFSIYRIGDVGIILAMWLSHHLWHESVTFSRLLDLTSVQQHIQEHSIIGVFIALTLLITATAKSAQFPFTSWLPRAMEGPTPSSAIFYGSLSVHLGVFLLMRTYPLWEFQTTARVLIALVGVVTAVVATGIARVQSSIKSQIAYASAAQIGLIFVELSLGWIDIALIHFAGNAFLRTYQLLVSPSVVSYLIREQFFNYSPNDVSIEDRLPLRLGNTFYVLGIKEFNLDSYMYRFFWNPLKVVGKKMNFLSEKVLLIIAAGFMLVGSYLLYIHPLEDESSRHVISFVFALVGLIMVLKAFTERRNAFAAWWLIVSNHIWVSFAVTANEHYSWHHNFIYLSGILVAGFTGYFLLRSMRARVGDVSLDRFHGYVSHYPKTAMAFFLCCLGVSGFPITPSFIGEDLIFSHIHEDQAGLAILVSLSLIVDGIALIRIFARVFFGPSVKSVYESSYRSS
jgi:NADH:ubiquinone oxidoreductase subunit 5 (subunit L)/multisubunit Na+/H+ antiporter MnhA subunit